jgi:hypothetical protein
MARFRSGASADRRKLFPHIFQMAALCRDAATPIPVAVPQCGMIPLILIPGAWENRQKQHIDTPDCVLAASGRDW